MSQSGVVGCLRDRWRTRNLILKIDDSWLLKSYGSQHFKAPNSNLQAPVRRRQKRRWFQMAAHAPAAKRGGTRCASSPRARSHHSLLFKWRLRCC